MSNNANTKQDVAEDERQQYLHSKFFIASSEGMSNSEIMELILYRAQLNVRYTG
ncbi:hypothetical protein [Candidatus Mesenet endosymbiont of Phosphuga atrata]|uniref:hypothetical protein n=1 Tax=Candidatus Mesenet endosymbiont of Phosphuga atrata TaxID=3066221 RepID=UPI0030D01BEB